MARVKSYGYVEFWFTLKKPQMEKSNPRLSFCAKLASQTGLAHKWRSKLVNNTFET